MGDWLSVDKAQSVVLSCSVAQHKAGKYAVGTSQSPVVTALYLSVSTCHTLSLSKISLWIAGLAAKT